MRDVYVRGSGMTTFGLHAERSPRELVEEAVGNALAMAGVTHLDVGAVFVGNAVAGLISGQESIRGQVVLRNTGLLGKPIINVENACASSSTAMHLGVSTVAGGAHEHVLVVGYEKLFTDDRAKSLSVFNASMDLDEMRERFGDEAGSERSVFLDLYAEMLARDPISSDALASVVVKNRQHGALNQRAQHRAAVTAGEVLASRGIVGPLTRLMCSTLCDGAAAVVLSADPSASVRVAASILLSGSGDDESAPPAEERAAQMAYEDAGLGPTDLDVVELHDATAVAELHLYERLGLCARGEAEVLLASGATGLGGRLPVNPSGGLLSRGHPIGATGVAQIVELHGQLTATCGARQVHGARVALAQNAGGYVGRDAAACAVHILVA